mgnify:CR=1 FL=1
MALRDASHRELGLQKWKDQRLRVLKRDGYICQRCGMEATHVDHIIKALTKMRSQSSIYLVVDDLHHLGRTGRVNNMGAIIGALLKIKPILTFENGYINLRKKVRTLKKAYLEVIAIMNEAGLDDSSKIMIAHANGLENALLIHETIKLVFPNKEIEICELSPVVSVHTGPNTVGVAWIK